MNVSFVPLPLVFSVVKSDFFSGREKSKTRLILIFNWDKNILSQIHNFHLLMSVVMSLYPLQAN